MPSEQISTDINIAKLLAGVFGAFVSMRFIQGTLVERLLLAVGGAALAYYASTPVSNILKFQEAEGLVGFLIGMFGMAIVSKLYEVIQNLNAAKIASDVWDAAVRKWKA